MTSEVDVYKRCQVLEDTRRTIALANVRARPTAEVIASVATLHQRIDAPEILLRLGELELEGRQEDLLASAVQQLAAIGDELDAKARAKVDRHLGRLCRLLPASKLVDLAVTSIDHRRKARRTLACRILSDVGLNEPLTKHLERRFEETRDQQLVTLIARDPDAVMWSDLDRLLSSLAEPYWRARVLQVLLFRSPNLARALANRYPIPFLWAVGRAEESSCLPQIVELHQTHSGDEEFLPLYAWALGKLGARKELQTLTQEVDEELQRLEEQHNVTCSRRTPR